MNFAAIDAALVKAFMDGAFFAPERVQTENEKFTLPTGRIPWARLTNLPAAPEVATLGDGGLDLHQGILQVDLFYPIGTGRAKAMAKADDIARRFTAGTGFTYQDQFVRITKCGRSSGRQDNGWFTVMLSINWKAHVER